MSKQSQKITSRRKSIPIHERYKMVIQKKEQNLDQLRKNVEQHERERNPEDFEPSFKPDTKKS